MTTERREGWLNGLIVRWVLACGCEPEVEHCEVCDERRRRRALWRARRDRRLSGADEADGLRDLLRRLWSFPSDWPDEVPDELLGAWAAAIGEPWPMAE